MEVIRKNLGMTEVHWKLIVIPRANKDLLPRPGTTFELHEGSSVFEAKVDNQYRIRSAGWFRHHPTMKSGDEIILSKENGGFHIILSTEARNGIISTRELLGKETAKGKIMDIEHTPDGPVAVVQRLERIPLNEVLKES